MLRCVLVTEKSFSSVSRREQQFTPSIVSVIDENMEDWLYFALSDWNVSDYCIDDSSIFCLITIANLIFNRLFSVAHF